MTKIDLDGLWHYGRNKTLCEKEQMADTTATLNGRRSSHENIYLLEEDNTEKVVLSHFVCIFKLLNLTPTLLPFIDNFDERNPFVINYAKIMTY